MNPPRRLLLASTSVHRRGLLQRLGLPFEAIAPGTDETPVTGEAPAERALRLALAKARAVAAVVAGHASYGEAIVIGSDQVACVGSRVLDKPGNEARAREQLAALCGQEACFHTAVAVLGGAEPAVTHVDITRVRLRPLTGAEIESYLRREPALDCAGSFKSEGLGIALFERIESQDPTALVGLPLIWLAGALRGMGLPLP